MPTSSFDKVIVINEEAAQRIIAALEEREKQPQKIIPAVKIKMADPEKLRAKKSL